jgi:acetyl-CoA C-acetyltransferase
MNKVAIVGYGNTKFSREDIPIESLLLNATKSLFDENPNLSQKDIDTVLVSTNDNSKYLSAILSELVGIQPNTAHTVESLCNSGTNSVVSAYSYIASGIGDVALVVGAERRDSPGQVLEWDRSRGEYKHPIFWGTFFTKSHKRKFGTTEEDLATVSAKNHKYAQDNPNAYSNKAYSWDEIINSKNLTDDLRVSDCSRPCSGASAVLITSEKTAKQFTDRPVWIKGIGQKTLSAGFTKNQDFSSMESTKEAAKIAFEMSKLKPEDVDIAEIHDAFTVCELMALEDLGLVEKGHSSRFVKTLYETSDRKINPRGGLIGSGHPLGATGIAQLIEATQQLQGTAKKRQINNANVGLVHNMSAAATSSTVLLLKS